MDDAIAVLQAVAVLHAPNADSQARRQADQFLQAWRTSSSSWRTSLLLLLQPTLQLADTDRYFFACCLRYAAQKSAGDILEPLGLGTVVDRTSLALLASVLRGSHAVSNQLATALSALAVRSNNWDASRIIPDFASLFQRSAQAMHEWAAAPEPSSVPLDLVPCLALLQLLQSMVAEARNKQCSVHPARRAAVAVAVASSPEPIRWVRLALAVQGPHAAACSIQGLALIEEYCNLGGPPVGLDSHEDLLAAICQRVLSADTCKAAAQCLAAAYAACGAAEPVGAAAGVAGVAGRLSSIVPPPPPPPLRSNSNSLLRSVSSPLDLSSAASTPRDPKLLFQLLQHWQATGYSVSRPGRASDPSGGGDGVGAASEAPPSHPAEVMLAACTVLSAACSVLLRPALGAPTPSGGSHSLSQGRTSAPEVRVQQASLVGYQHYFRMVAEQLLLHLQHGDDEVALVAASFFSCTYLPELKSALQPTANPEYRRALLDQHASLLQRLTESLVLRTQLRPEVAAVATADARDIPDDARTVRRELAGMLRDISSLVGHTAMLQFMAALVQPGYQQLDQSNPQQQAQGGQFATQRWVRLECALYAANVVTGRWVSETWNTRGTRGTAMPAAPSAVAAAAKRGGGAAAGGFDEEDELLEDNSDEEDDMDDESDELEEGEEEEEGQGMEGQGMEGMVAAPLGGGALSGEGTGSQAAAGSEPEGEAKKQYQRSRMAPSRRVSSIIGGEADVAVGQLVEVAAMSSVHPSGSCKLAGTALTLLGGLACWYADRVLVRTPQQHPARNTAPPLRPHATSQPYMRSQSSPLRNPAEDGPLESAEKAGHSEGSDAGGSNSSHSSAYARSQSSPLQNPEPGSTNSVAAATAAQSPLPSVLLAVLQAIKSDDAKLSRNGATTLQRLCAHEGLARHLLACHSSWVDTLVSVYLTRGGMLQRAGPHEDSSTEELLLMTLCRLACLSSGSRQLLLHLATPQVQQVQQALAELVAARDAAAAPGSVGTLFGAAAGLTCAALVTQCGKSLDVLTAIMESCRLGGRGSGGEAGRPPPPPPLHGGSSAAAAEAAASAAAAADQVLGLTRAVWWVLHEGLQPELLQPQGSVDLASAVATFMAAAMQTFLAASRAVPASAPSVSASGTPPASPAVPPVLLLLEPLSWALNLLEVVPVLLLSTPKIVDLLLACLDAHAALQRQLASNPGLANASATGGSATAGATGAAGGSGGGSTGPNGAPGGSGPTVADLPSLTQRLGTVVSGALVAGFANLVNPLSSPQVDSSHTSSLLRLCCSCMRLLPSCFVHSPSTPDLMLSATLVACYSLDMDQCRAAMDWCQCLCSQPFIATATPPMASAAPHAPPPPPPPPAPPLSPASAAAHAQLRTWLDGTAGAKVVQALLLSASGSMPSCLVLPVSTALHRIWRGVGTDRFLRWSDMALIMLVPSPPSPWQHLKPEHRSALLRDLVSPECAHDVPRFKRVVKSLCGGKRKGEGTGPVGGRGIGTGVSSRSLGHDPGGLHRTLAQEQALHLGPGRVRSLSRDHLLHGRGGSGSGGHLGGHGGLQATHGVGVNAMALGGMGMNSLNSMNSINSIGSMNGMAGVGMGAMAGAMGQGMLPPSSMQQLAGMAQMGLGPGGGYAQQQQQQPVSWVDMGHGQYGMLMGGALQPHQGQYGLQPQGQYGGGAQAMQGQYGGGAQALQVQYGGGAQALQGQYGALPMNLPPHAISYLLPQGRMDQQRR